MSLELDYLSELSATKRQLSHQEDDISKFYFFVKKIGMSLKCGVVLLNNYKGFFQVESHKNCIGFN